MSAERKASALIPTMISCNYPLTDTPDGVKDVVLGQKKYLSREGFDITLVGPRVCKFPFIGDVPDNRADHKLGVAIPFALNNTHARNTVTMFKRGAKEILQEVAPELVILHEPLAGTAAHNLITAANTLRAEINPAFVGYFHAQTENLDFRTRLITLLARWCRRPELRRFGRLTPGPIPTIVDNLDGRIAVSSATAQFWQDRFGGDYQVIHNGIDIEDLTPPTDDPQEIFPEWVKDGKKIIMFTGRHDPRKGVDDLIRAYAVLRGNREDIILKIIGRGIMTDDLKDLVNALQLPGVEFIEPLSRKDLIRAYKTASQYGVCVSTPKGGEGFGLVLPEAMACGSLVVGTKVEGYREALSFGKMHFAKLASPEDPHSIAKEIATLLDLPSDIQDQFRNQARTYVEERFSMASKASEVAKYCRGILESRYDTVVAG